MAKHFTYTITGTGFTYVRDEARIAPEAAPDGIYVFRTNVQMDTLAAPDVVAAYKGLPHVERAFCTMKSADMGVRPVCHRKDARIRAHVLVCMLAHHMLWHMKRALAPVLFTDDDPAGGAAARALVVAPAERSPVAKSRGESLTTARRCTAFARSCAITRR